MHFIENKIESFKWGTYGNFNIFHHEILSIIHIYYRFNRQREINKEGRILYSM